MPLGLSGLLLFLEDAISGRCVRDCKKSLLNTQWLKSKQLREMQTRRLKELLTYAYENVPYYHQTFKKADFEPSDFKEFEDLCRIPILRRATLVNQTSSLISNEISKNQVTSWKTSGTTAAPVKFYKDVTDVSWGVAAELRGYGWAGYNVGSKLGLIWSIESGRAASPRFKFQNHLIRSSVFNISSISEAAMADYAEKLERFRPEFIRGYATATNLFAAFLTNDGEYSIRPKAVFTSASTLLPHYRKNIERAFDCKVYDYYASAEMSHIAAQCGEHEGLHISEENVAVEIVKDEEHAALGEEGQVILTNLNSHSMPFVRYEIGDLGKIYSEDCSCGRGLRLMQPIGRKYEYFVNTDGTFTSLCDLQTVFETLPIEDYQIVQEDLDDIVVKIVKTKDYREEHSEFILKNIKFRGKARIRIEFVDGIPLEESGKLKHAVSRISSKYSLD